MNPETTTMTTQLIESNPVILWVLVTIISSLISGIAGVFISSTLHRRNEKYTYKLKVLNDFVSNRYCLKGDKFTRSLNAIFIVFQDSQDVLNKLEAFHEVVVSQQKTLADDKLISLFRAMCQNLKINPSKFVGESFFLKAFNIKG